MFFRFGSALVLVVLIALTGTALEKQNLELRRAVSRQHYRLDVLLDLHASHRVRAQQWGAPTRLVEAIDEAAAKAEAAAKSKQKSQRANPSRRQKRAKAPHG
jgi:hypothetical protein